MSRNKEAVRPKRIYGKPFFRSLTARVLQKCGLERHLAEFLPEVPRPITQFEFWDGMREMADYLSRKGCQSFSRAALYHERSRPLTAEQVASDLVEAAAWYAGGRGSEVLLGRPFPQSEYEECVLIALFYALVSVVEGREKFTACFEEHIPNGSRAHLIHKVLHGRTPKERWEGYVPLRMWISAQALDFLEKFLVSMVVDERSAFKDFLDEWMTCWHIDYLTADRLARIIAMYFASRAGCGRHAIFVAAWPPLLEIVPKSAPRRRGEDSHQLLLA